MKARTQLLTLVSMATLALGGSLSLRGFFSTPRRTIRSTPKPLTIPSAPFGCGFPPTKATRFQIAAAFLNFGSTPDRELMTPPKELTSGSAPKPEIGTIPKRAIALTTISMYRPQTSSETI